MRWKDLLDVAIVAFIVYRVLLLIKGTRAMQMLTGLGILGIGFFLSSTLELFTTHWLLSYFFDYLILIIIVVFQDDLRRALTHVGKNPFFSASSVEEEREMVDEIARAATRLASERIGGLIVLERDADLADHLGEAGVELDAKVTKELLCTLFVPDADNHMHDGAVIIKNLRVQQAGALLPLSANAKLDKQLGTRHRAAIGITEQTDAVVVVVSEERGLVSLCFNGNIARDLAPATLRKALLGLFQKKTKGKRPTPPRVGKGRSEPPPAPRARDAAPPAPSSSSKKIPATEMSGDVISLVVTQPISRPSHLPASAMTPRREAQVEATEGAAEARPAANQGPDVEARAKGPADALEAGLAAPGREVQKEEAPPALLGEGSPPAADQP